MGTSASCLSLYDRSRDRFLNFPASRRDSSSNRSGTIYTILESRSGGPWLATAFGIVRVDIPTDTGPGNLDSLARAIRFTEFPAGSPRNRVVDLCERKDGRIVAASDSGLLIFDPLTHASPPRPCRSVRTQTRFHLRLSVPGSRWQSLAGDQMGRCVLCRVGVWKVLQFRHKKETASRSVMTASGTLRSIQGETCGSGRSKRGIPSLFSRHLAGVSPISRLTMGRWATTGWPFR